MIDSNNMTHEEFYRIDGFLTPARIDAVLSEVDNIKAYDVREYAPYAQEASSQFPAEDFLSEQVSALQEFAKRLRGDNKKDLQHIIECISDALQCQFYASDYGMAELNKIIRTIKR